MCVCRSERRTPSIRVCRPHECVRQPGLVIIRHAGMVRLARSCSSSGATIKPVRWRSIHCGGGWFHIGARTRPGVASPSMPRPRQSRGCGHFGRYIRRDDASFQWTGSRTCILRCRKSALIVELRGHEDVEGEWLGLQAGFEPASACTLVLSPWCRGLVSSQPPRVFSAVLSSIFSDRLAQSPLLLNV
jgi:hypothetical protein